MLDIGHCRCDALRDAKDFDSRSGPIALSHIHTVLAIDCLEVERAAQGGHHIVIADFVLEARVIFEDTGAHSGCVETNASHTQTYPRTVGVVLMDRLLGDKDRMCVF